VTLRASVAGATVERRLLLDRAAEVRLPAAPDWVVVNAGGHGFYRVGYTADLLARLTSHLPALRPIERFGLVGDLFALAQAGACPAREFLAVTARFRDETDRNVWTALTGALAYLHRVLDAEDRADLAGFVRDRVGPAAARLGWTPRPGESELTRQLRGDLLRVLGVLGDEAETQARAREAYTRYRTDEASVDPNVLAATIAILARSGGEAEYGEFLERYRRARNPQEEQRYLFALAGFRPPALVRQTLDRCLGGEVRTQDAPYLVRAVLASVHGRGLAWEFVRTHWREMARLYPPSAYRRMWEGVTALVSLDWEREVLAFFPEHGIVLGGKTLDQYLEQLRVAVAFREREAAELGEYLRSGGFSH
jgi:puromycin-sensitive aminopeptidase